MKTIRSFFVTLIVVLLIGGIFIFYKKDLRDTAENIANIATDSASDSSSEGKSTSIVDEAKKKVVATVVEKAIETYAGSAGDEVKEALDSVSEEDKDKITDILADNLSVDSVTDVQEYITNKDTDGLMEYAKDKLTAEDYSDLTGILEKYSDEIQKKIDEAAD